MVPATKSGQDASFSKFGGWHLFPFDFVVAVDEIDRAVAVLEAVGFKAD